MSDEQIEDLRRARRALQDQRHTRDSGTPQTKRVKVVKEQQTANSFSIPGITPSSFMPSKTTLLVGGGVVVLAATGLVIASQMGNNKFGMQTILTEKKNHVPNKPLHANAGDNSADISWP